MPTIKKEKMTCQVCGKAVMASTGTIAHHGYERPYQEGWQSASCDGTGYVPYEVGCERLREISEVTRAYIARKEAALTEFLANPPQTITRMERRSAWDQYKEAVYEKPENFQVGSYGASIPKTYACAYSMTESDYKIAIRNAKSSLVIMERRVNDWHAVITPAV
jgi:hypothetical protein